MNEIAERCAPFEEDLSALLDGQLGATRASEVRAHAESCPDCAGRIAALQRVGASLQRLAATPVSAARTVQMRSALAARLREGAAASAHRSAPSARRAPRRSRWLAPVAFAATAAAAAALFLVMRPESGVEPATQGVVAAQVPVRTRADAELAARDLSAKLDTPIGASVPNSGDVVAATNAALPARLEDASDEELELATALRSLPALDAPGDLDVVEQLDLVESLGSLDAEPAGRG